MEHDPTMESTSTTVTTAAVPAARALVVAPVVGTVVLLFVAVGLVAVAVGALTGLAGHRGVTRHGRRA